jgi:hypothetical protein
MTPLFKKLNYKNQKEIFILNPPASFGKELDLIREVTIVKSAIDETSAIEFILAFGTKQAEVDNFARSIHNKIKGDAVVWFAYPKGTSKTYKCEFNRDNGWQIMGELGFEPVRMVAIDEDWSALRFRKAEHIKKMTRSFAMTDQGKAKISKGKDL